MILGHLTTTAVIVRLSDKTRTKAVYFAALLGAYFPEIIDKTFAQIFNVGSQRGWGHSLIFNLFVSILAAGILRVPKFQKYRRPVTWFVLGCYLHLAEDVLSLDVLCWPFLGPLPPRMRISIMDMFYHYYVLRTHLHILIPEMVGHLAFFVLFGRDFFKARLRSAAKAETT